jgi:hypothetical protein
VGYPVSAHTAGNTRFVELLSYSFDLGVVGRRKQHLHNYELALEDFGPSAPDEQLEEVRNHPRDFTEWLAGVSAGKP